jgi:hypothetical protein
MRRLATVAVVAASLLLTPVPPAQAKDTCWPGEVWMTAEGYPFCALASPQGGCYYCIVEPIFK